MGQPINPPAPSIDFSTLRLVRCQGEEDEDGNPVASPPEPELAATYPNDHDPCFNWLRVHELDIKDNDGREYGRLVLNVIDLVDLEDFQAEFRYQPETDDLETLADIFEDDCSFDLRSNMDGEGTGAFGSRDNVYPGFCYLNTLKVGREFQGKDIESWALSELRDRLLPIYGYQYLFTWPIASQGYYRAWCDPPLSKEQQEEAFAPVLKTYHQNGFRRVGTTPFFCYVDRDEHPSKNILPEKDAALVVSN